MKPPLYLHIGHGKVASSTIQAALEANIDGLRAQGCLVADEQMRFPAEGAIRANPVPYFTTMREQGPEGMLDFARRMGALEEHRGTGRFQKAVISAENLTAPGLEQLLPTLRHEFEVHVLYYIRRPDDWLISAWKQWGLKQGVGLAEFCRQSLENGQPPFRRVVERWAPGASSIRVRPLHRSALHGGGVVQDVFHAIGCEPEVVDIPPVNPSFDLGLLEVMAASPFLFDGPNDNRLFHHLERTLPEGFPVERATLGRNLLERIHSSFTPDLQAMHRRFFPDVDFEEVFGWREPEEVVPASEPLDRVRRVLGYQLGQLEDLARRIRELEDRSGGRP